jgi:hypothetical protein
VDSVDDSEAATKIYDPQVMRARIRVGRVLCEKWRLDVLLGVGGMAAVYAATHRNGSRVAVKILHPELTINTQVRSRFTSRSSAYEGGLVARGEWGACSRPLSNRRRAAKQAIPVDLGEHPFGFEADRTTTEKTIVVREGDKDRRVRVVVRSSSMPAERDGSGRRTVERSEVRVERPDVHATMPVQRALSFPDVLDRQVAETTSLGRPIGKAAQEPCDVCW